MLLASCWEHASLPSTGQGVGGKAENGDVPMPFLPAAKHFHFCFKEIPVPSGSYPSGERERVGKGQVPEAKQGGGGADTGTQKGRG